MLRIGLKQICVDNWEIKESRIRKVKIPGKENILKRASSLLPATIDLHSLPLGAFVNCGAGYRQRNPKYGMEQRIKFQSLGVTKLLKLEEK